METVIRIGLDGKTRRIVYDDDGEAISKEEVKPDPKPDDKGSDNDNPTMLFPGFAG